MSPRLLAPGHRLEGCNPARCSLTFSERLPTKFARSPPAPKSPSAGAGGLVSEHGVLPGGLGLGAGGGSFLAARTHGADSLGQFQNTSHAPGLNFKKLGHLHIQNAPKKKKGKGGKKSQRRAEHPPTDASLRRGVCFKG